MTVADFYGWAMTTLLGVAIIVGLIEGARRLMRRVRDR